MAPGREPRLFAGAPGLGPRSPRATGLTAFGMGSQALEDDQFVVLVATHWRRAFYIEVLGIGYQFTGVGIDQHRQASGLRGQVLPFEASGSGLAFCGKRQDPEAPPKPLRSPRSPGPRSPRPRSGPINGAAPRLSIAASCLARGCTGRSCTAPAGRARCSR